MHSHLQLLGELCGQHSLPQLPPSLSAAKTTAPTEGLQYLWPYTYGPILMALYVIPFCVTAVSLSEDLLAQRMKDFALPSTNKQSLVRMELIIHNNDALHVISLQTTAIKQDTCTASLDAKQCHTPSELLTSSRVHQDLSVTSHQQQVEQQPQQNLKCRKARGAVCKNGKTFRARVKSRRLLNQLRKRKQFGVSLVSFRRYQTPWKADRCYTALLRRYSSRRKSSRDKQLQSQTALQKRIASNHIDDILSILKNE